VDIEVKGQCPTMDRRLLKEILKTGTPLSSELGKVKAVRKRSGAP